MRKLLIAFLVLGSTTVPAMAQNNCISWKCFTPPPYLCQYCDLTYYNGASDCHIVESYDGTGRDFCFLSGSCDTGMGDECFPSASGSPCGPDQIWVRSLNPKPLNEDWALVRVSLAPKTRKHA